MVPSYSNRFFGKISVKYEVNLFNFICTVQVGGDFRAGFLLSLQPPEVTSHSLLTFLYHPVSSPLNFFNSLGS
jgi:hypothetical protein